MVLESETGRHKRVSLRVSFVYVKSHTTQQYDSAFFLDDYEAIHGIGKAEAQSRATDLASISKIIRTVLL